jgi:hypothetical protein
MESDEGDVVTFVDDKRFDTVESEYSMKHVAVFAKAAASLGTSVRLEVYKDDPLLVHIPFGASSDGRKNHLQFFLAPKITHDD